MAQACDITGGAGGGKGLEMALGQGLRGKLQECETDLPDDIKEKCMAAIEAAVGKHMNIGDAIKYVQNGPLKELDDRFKGQRFKGFIKFDFDTNVVTINVNKFAGGNSGFSSSIGTRSSYCPDPFMGRLSDPNMNKR